MADKTKVENGVKMEGQLFSNGMMLVQKKKTLVGGVKADGTQDYFYNLTITDGQDLLSCTSGKVADDMQLGHGYILGFNYLDKKLKLVSFREVAVE